MFKKASRRLASVTREFVSAPKRKGNDLYPRARRIIGKGWRRALREADKREIAVALDSLDYAA